MNRPFRFIHIEIACCNTCLHYQLFFDGYIGIIQIIQLKEFKANEFQITIFENYYLTTHTHTHTHIHRSTTTHSSFNT